MQRRDVVTAFLTRERDGKLEVLLLRRAEEAPTYPGRWSGVSGICEERDPLLDALREIVEETRIPPGELRLVGPRALVRVAAPEIGVRWMVHAFRFEVEHGAPDPVLDRENLDWGWLPAEALRRLPTVPALGRAYRATAGPGPTAAQVAARVAGELRRDNESGSSSLAGRAVSAYLEAVLRARSDAGLARPAARLARARPEMAILTGALATAAAGQPDEAIDRCLATLRRVRNAVREIAVVAGQSIEGTVITLSSSSAVLAAVLENRDRVERVILSEGRPAGEGVRLAREIAAGGVPVTLVADAALPGLAAEADVAMFGADAVAADGSVLNKTGSLALALAAARFRIPCYALAETLKVTRTLPRVPERPGGELLARPPSGVRVANRYFEAVPGDLLTGVMTEKGVLAGEELAGLAKRMDERREALLGERR